MAGNIADAFSAIPVPGSIGFGGSRQPVNHHELAFIVIHFFNAQLAVLFAAVEENNFFLLFLKLFNGFYGIVNDIAEEGIGF